MSETLQYTEIRTQLLAELRLLEQQYTAEVASSQLQQGQTTPDNNDHLDNPEKERQALSDKVKKIASIQNHLEAIDYYLNYQPDESMTDPHARVLVLVNILDILMINLPTLLGQEKEILVKVSRMQVLYQNLKEILVGKDGKVVDKKRRTTTDMGIDITKIML